ncbi:hypothetical protein QQS21_009891 [Conoideocrella luteorostrata]|uniref:Peptidase A1 domain-containing protein n=1 Tax=Conoideocrella luteorostrata TaxID=1105319 RepID=A0AAJ0FV80_9HYPO|nr:hypothetical protein QQS21_009891 [Conoideocrella luteorostrata]
MALVKTVAFLLVSTALASPAQKKGGSNEAARSQNSLLQLPLFTVPIDPEVVSGNTPKREVSTGIDNYQYNGRWPVTALGVELNIGTPPQKVIIEPDTGSPILWVPGFTPKQNFNTSEGIFFQYRNSTSLHDLKKRGVIGYMSGSVTIDMVSDEVSIGGSLISNMTFGIGNMSHPRTRVSRYVGTMGLLPSSDQEDPEFILTKLRDKKLVKSRAFSIGLREKGKGALTFGGYDTSKFSGPLEKFSMVSNAFNHYIIKIDSLSFNKDNGSHELLLDKQSFKAEQMTIGLDSGSPLLSIPKAVANNFQKRLGDLWIGGHFLRRSLVVFDPDESSIWIARGADCGSSAVAIDDKVPSNVLGRCKNDGSETKPPANEGF